MWAYVTKEPQVVGSLDGRDASAEISSGAPPNDCDYESPRKLAKMQIPLLSLGSEVGPEALHV